MSNNKVVFFIDGIAYMAEAGKGLIEAAQENGIHIPTLCYFDTLPPLGTCRMCTVGVNGRPAAACTTKIEENMVIAFGSSEMRDLRRGVLEMMFAEGNHFCPTCSKSGNCEMQRWGYQMEVSATRYPHLFEEHRIDYHPKRIVLEKNRCILCKRCVEEVKTDEGERVFSFRRRGHNTVIGIDYEAEAQLSEQQAQHAMQICPVGAIMVRGKIEGETPGQRKYDASPSKKRMHAQTLPRVKEKKDKYLVATASLAGCFGCHMSMLDIDMGILDMLELVDFHKSPLTDIKEFGQRCDIGLIEGGCCNEDNVAGLIEFRKNCDILISVGECAIMGGVPAMRNTIPLGDCLREAYLDGMTVNPESPSTIPVHEDVPRLLDKVYACHDIVKIDYFVSGCPPSSAHIWEVIKSMLTGEDFSLLYEQYKYD